MRVIVNRVWKEHFGTGLVDTPSNFGIMGERPTNPELLDYLAQWFVDNGMSIKKLHREIMLSAVYQLSDEGIAGELREGSRESALLARQPASHGCGADSRFDAARVGRRLDTKMGGPSEPLTPDYTRRTVYGKVSRYRLDEYLQLFDFPSPNLSRREALRHHRAAAAAVLHEQRFRAAAGRASGAARGNGAGQYGADPEALSADLRPRARLTKKSRSASTILRTEPLKEYEEQKAAKEKAKRKGRQRKSREGKAKRTRARRAPKWPRLRKRNGTEAGSKPAAEPPGAGRPAAMTK